MHIVINPLSASTHSDIALMEAVVGFFGRLEFMTFGEAAFTQTSEFVNQARRIVVEAVAQNKHTSPGELNGQGDALSPSPGALISDVEDTSSDRRPGITVHDADDDPVGESIQPMALEPISTVRLGAPEKQHDSRCIGTQVTDYVVHDVDPPDFGGTFPTLHDNIMSGGINLSLGALPGEYWSDEWLAANSLDVV